jgi:hypothetical protein
VTFFLSFMTKTAAGRRFAERYQNRHGIPTEQGRRGPCKKRHPQVASIKNLSSGKRVVRVKAKPQPARRIKRVASHKRKQVSKGGRVTYISIKAHTVHIHNTGTKNTKKKATVKTPTPKPSKPKSRRVPKKTRAPTKPRRKPNVQYRNKR